MHESCAIEYVRVDTFFWKLQSEATAAKLALVLGRTKYSYVPSTEVSGLPLKT